MDKNGDSGKINQATGFHSVTSALEINPNQVAEVVIDNKKPSQRTKRIISLAKLAHVPVRMATGNELNILSGGENHQGVIARLKNQSGGKSRVSSLDDTLADLNGYGLFLILDHIQDPHNLGACLRTAECAGVDAVILPKEGACPVNQTVRKVASGAAESINIINVANLVNTFKKLKEHGFWIYGASDQGESMLYQTDFSDNVAIVLGAEGAGLRRLTSEHCDFLVNIPMQGLVSSLNVSVATGILLFEINRQREVVKK